MALSKTVLALGFVVLLVVGYLCDEWIWRARPRARLIEMVRTSNWRLHNKAMAELRRRNEDLSSFLPKFLWRLGAESKVERAAAQLVIRKFYPEVAEELRGYSPTASVKSCREHIAPLLKRYPPRGDA